MAALVAAGVGNYRRPVHSGLLQPWRQRSRGRLSPQSSLVPERPFAERFRARLKERATGIVAALLLEGVLLLLLLSLGRSDSPRQEGITFVDFKAIESSDTSDAPEETAEPEPPATERVERESAETPVEAVRAPPPVEAPVVPVPARPTIPAAREPDPRYGVGPRPIQDPPPPGPVAGPVNSGAVSGDTARVGTAPNGEPLYAAAWYRKPYDDELRGYLSTATGPGWGLIACRTAPDYRVEDCVGLDESPRGSMIMRAVLAAAWQFKVRPPRLGGKPQIGEWVRIRIDYTMRPAG